MKYHKDMEQKLSREQVAVAESIVRRAVFELVEELAPSLTPEMVAQTYAFATGSFYRGAPASSDVDMLIILPPGMDGQDCGQFLQQLLTRLLHQDRILLDEMAPSAPQRHSHPSRCSWMGLCNIPGFPDVARRIDFKVYARKHLTFAVNYFANSQSFCRATRHWAQRACTEAAQKLAGNPDVTGFRLSDQALTPVLPDGKVLAPVPCEDETALFRVLGLNYVPNTMRFLGMDYF